MTNRFENFESDSDYEDPPAAKVPLISLSSDEDDATKYDFCYENQVQIVYIQYNTALVILCIGIIYLSNQIWLKLRRHSCNMLWHCLMKGIISMCFLSVYRITK